MIDTHTHIQFKIFDKNRDQVIEDSKKAEVAKIIAVGTNLETSKKAVEIANKYPEVFASVGIHPHHVFKHLPPVIARSEATWQSLKQIESMLGHPKVLAVGETGMDKHIYKNTIYHNYVISKEFLNLQKYFFAKQIKLAIKHKKALIIHNREAAKETLDVLRENWDQFLERRCVFHFCEPDIRLLDFAKKRNVYIGVDRDLLTDKTKQEFVKNIPLELLVLETDSPFVSSEPKGLLEILEFISRLLKRDTQEMEKITSQNSQTLFKL